MAAKTIEIRILILSLVALLSTEVATRVVLSEATYSPLLVLGVARVVEILLLLLIVSRWGKGMSSVGLARDQTVAGLKKGLIWSAVFGLCAFLGFAILYATHIEDPLRLIKTHLPPGTQGIVLLFVVGGLVSPIAEEVFFRGIVYGFLRRWGVLVAMVGSTVIFVLAHPIISGIPATQIVGGLVFAVAYEVEGNLMVPITIHVLGNMAIFSLSLVS
ncbi:MAG: CPBP family intramembrane metalloprotease [Desulfobacterales bacterium]|nr:CPBP family intramembrane metalloprotease [Desulfobacterales bacterium]